jgi:hypothetical protein
MKGRGFSPRARIKTGDITNSEVISRVLPAREDQIRNTVSYSQGSGENTEPLRRLRWRRFNRLHLHDDCIHTRPMRRGAKGTAQIRIFSVSKGGHFAHTLDMLIPFILIG